MVPTKSLWTQSQLRHIPVQKQSPDHYVPVEVGVVTGKGWRLIESRFLYDETTHKITANSKNICDWLAQQPSRHVQKELRNRTWYIDDQRLTLMVLKWG
jgi:hypothetical protein